jgi:hypothetical protein
MDRMPTLLEAFELNLTGCQARHERLAEGYRRDWIAASTQHQGRAFDGLQGLAEIHSAVFVVGTIETGSYLRLNDRTLLPIDIMRRPRIIER